MPEAKVVIVTGCDSGFGLEAANTLQARGYEVLAGCFTKQGCDAFKGTKGITGLQLDVTSDDSVATFGKAVEDFCKKNGANEGLYGLINNAGMAPTGFVEWAPLADLQKAMDINVYGQIRVTKACLPLIRKAKGRIINVSSICGRLAFAGAGWYACTKFAVEGWTDSLRREMRPFGVTVHLVEPGFFKTGMVNVDQYKVQLEKQFAALSAEQKAAYGHQCLVGYGENIEDQVKMMADPDTSKVVNAMVEALESSFAKNRYPNGGSAKFFFLPISHMPTWLADGVLSGINPKYKPDGTVGRVLPRRLDLVAIWLIFAPLLAFGLFQANYAKLLGGYPKVVASFTSIVIAWCWSWKRS